MSDFPTFMKSAANRIASTSQHTKGIEGYVFDGIDGTQMAFWTCTENAETAEHIHPFDEWFVVLEGEYTLVINGKEHRLGPGTEHFIPRGSKLTGRVQAGTRTVHAFGGHRAQRTPVA